MNLLAKKSALRGRVPIPGSKSHTIRCVAIASLASGESELEAPLVSADTMAAVECYRKLGAAIDCGPTWRIKGTGGCLTVPDNIIDVANSGTTLRFAVGSAALLDSGTAVFTGDDQIRSRPLGPLLQSLNDLGAACLSTRNNGKAPVVVRGRMVGGQTSIEAVTSQYLSSLLINTPLAERDTTIRVTKLNEQPYVEITLRYLNEQGIQYTNDGMKNFSVRGGQSYRPFRKRIPADFSSATFFLCAGAILDADLILEGLDYSDAQGDKAVVDMLRWMGASIEISGLETRVRRSELKGIDIDMNATPDALPAMAVTACFAAGPTRLYNVPQARLKETDRIAVMNEELSKMGARIEEFPDGLKITPAPLHPAQLSGHSDHRIVMALSLAALALDGETTIDTAESVNVTFPDYAALMQSLGANIIMR